MTEQSINYTYKETVIAYDESRNLWLFLVRGREKSAASLRQANEIIDKPAPKTAKPFTKIDAWYMDYNEPGQRVTVTAVAEPDYRGRLAVWIKYPDGNRSKQTVEETIYPSTPQNEAIMIAISAEHDAIKEADKEINRLKKELQPLVIAPED